MSEVNVWDSIITLRARNIAKGGTGKGVVQVPKRWNKNNRIISNVKQVGFFSRSKISFLKKVNHVSRLIKGWVQIEVKVLVP